MTIEMNLQKGLVGHWTMNNIDSNSGEIKDKSGYNHNLSIDGPSKGYPGISGNSFNFVRSESDELNGSYSSLYVKREMTVVVNLRPRSFSDFQAVLVRRDSNDRFNYRLMLESGPQMRVRLDTGSSNSQIDDDVSVSLSTDEWYSIGFTYDGSDVVYYIDGDDIVTKSIGSHTWADAQGLKIGNETDNSRHFDGLISDARVYNRALSKQEMSSLSNISSNRSYSSPYVPQRPVAAGDLVAWYPFEGQASDATAFQPWAADDTDYSGTVNGATYQESGGVTDIRRGSNAAAYEFDTTGNIELFNHGLSSHSISCWLNTDVLGYDNGGSNALIFGYYDDGGATYTIINMNGDNLNYRIDDGSNSYTKVAGSSINTSEWNHAVLTYNSSTSDAKAYLDGSLLGDISYSSGIVFDTGEYYIGGNPVDGTNFDGKVDDCRIYNRALTESEVSSIYNNTEP